MDVLHHPSKSNLLAAGAGLVVGSLALSLYQYLSDPTPPLPTDTTLTYWNGRGKAEAIRLMLAAAGVPWTHAVPGYADVTHLDQPEHMQHLRDNDYLVAGQVPLLMMNGKKYVQSMATVRMLARRFHLSGSSFEEKTNVDIAAECVIDWRAAVGQHWEYGMGGCEPSEENKGKARRGCEKYLPLFEKMLLGRAWLGGTTKLSYADVLALEVLEQLMEGKHLTASGLVKAYPKVHAYYVRLRATPRLHAYLESDMRLTKTQEQVKQYKKSVNRTFGR